MKFLYTLSHQKMFVGTNYENQSYVLAFPNLKTALWTKTKIHPAKHDMFLAKYTYSSEAPSGLQEQQVTKHNNGFDLTIYATKGFYLHLAKHRPETPSFTIQTTPTEEIMMYPIFHNVGLILALDVMDETNEELVFSTEIIKPIQDPALFKMALP